jgi:hypothetical protein
MERPERVVRGHSPSCFMGQGEVPFSLSQLTAKDSQMADVLHLSGGLACLGSASLSQWFYWSSSA